MRSSRSWEGRWDALSTLALHAHCRKCSALGMASLHSRSWLHVRDMASHLGPEDGGLEMHSGSIQSWRLGRRSVLTRRGTPLDAPQSRRDAIEEMFLRELSRSMDPLTDRGAGTGIEAMGRSPGSDQSGPSWLALAKGDIESSERRLLGGFSGAETAARLWALCMLMAAFCWKDAHAVACCTSEACGCSASGFWTAAAAAKISGFCCCSGLIWLHSLGRPGRCRGAVGHAFGGGMITAGRGLGWGGLEGGPAGGRLAACRCGGRLRTCSGALAGAASEAATAT